MMEDERFREGRLLRRWFEMLEGKKELLDDSINPVSAECERGEVIATSDGVSSLTYSTHTGLQSIDAPYAVLVVRTAMAATRPCGYFTVVGCKLGLANW